MVAGKPFSYGISASLGDYKSKITKYKNDDMLLTDHYVGETLGELWGYRTDGLFKTRVYTSSDASAAHLMAGDVRFRDLDGNNIINNGDGTVKNPGDMRVIGNSLPRYTYSIRGDLNWNGFDFAVFFQGVGNRNTYFPRRRSYQTSSAGSMNVKTDRYLQDASYIRLKNITLGYTIPINKRILEKVRVYVSGENLAYWSPLKRYSKTVDPEVATTSATNDCLYPYSRTFSVGVDITF